MLGTRGDNWEREVIKVVGSARTTAVAGLLKQSGRVFRRVVIEKPFGSDLPPAEQAAKPCAILPSPEVNSMLPCQAAMKRAA